MMTFIPQTFIFSKEPNENRKKFPEFQSGRKIAKSHRKSKDVDGAFVGGAAEVLGVVAEIDAVDLSRVCSPAQLAQLDQFLRVPNADERSLRAGRRNHCALKKTVQDRSVKDG